MFREIPPFTTPDGIVLHTSLEAPKGTRELILGFQGEEAVSYARFLDSVTQEDYLISHVEFPQIIKIPAYKKSQDDLLVTFSMPPLGEDPTGLELGFVKIYRHDVYQEKSYPKVGVGSVVTASYSIQNYEEGDVYRTALNLNAIQVITLKDDFVHEYGFEKRKPQK